MKVDLENCPFCDDGHPQLVHLAEGHALAGHWQVQCTNYFCCAHGGAWPEQSTAIEVWNAREEMRREHSLLEPHP